MEKEERGERGGKEEREGKRREREREERGEKEIVRAFPSPSAFFSLKTPREKEKKKEKTHHLLDVEAHFPAEQLRQRQERALERPAGDGSADVGDERLDQIFHQERVALAVVELRRDKLLLEHAHGGPGRRRGDGARLHRGDGGLPQVVKAAVARPQLRDPGLLARAGAALDGGSAGDERDAQRHKRPLEDLAEASPW